MKNFDKKIGEILIARDELSLAKADVLRVLVINGGACWRTELSSDIWMLYSLKGDSKVVDESLMDKAIDELKKEGLLKVEKRLKSSLNERGVASEDMLSLVDFSKICGILSQDKILLSYMAKRAEDMHRALL